MELTDQIVLEKIKSRGYWEIHFIPLPGSPKLVELGSCLQLVDRCAVRLTGWPYPNVPKIKDNRQGWAPGNDFYEGWSDLGPWKDFWKLRQSWEFLSVRGLWEDWPEEHLEKPPESLIPGSSLGVTRTVFQLSMVFLFLARLIDAGGYGDAVKLEIALRNTRGRKLWVDDYRRLSFIEPYATAANEIQFATQYETQNIVKDSNTIALEVISHIFSRFGWDNIPLQSFKDDQKKLMQGFL